MIYLPYIHALRETIGDIKKYDESFQNGYFRVTYGLGEVLRQAQAVLRGNLHWCKPRWLGGCDLQGDILR